MNNLGQQLLPDNKDRYTPNSRLTPTEGSTRSDEGYHSNGGQDDVFTPPEDSSDSDSDNNYVLDFSVKSKKGDKEKCNSKTSSEVMRLNLIKRFPLIRH